MKKQFLVLLPILFCVGHSMHCLVTRPGYGLVSEQCPSATVACRIRIDHNAVEYYEYSPLHDQNQFVCVLRNEYGDIKESGCVKKRTGKVRCWCYGRSNCNTPEDSKKLYEAFQTGDPGQLRETVEEIDFPNLHNDDPSGISLSTTPFTTSTTRQTLKITEQKPAEKMGPRYSSDTNSPSSVSNYGVLKINNLPTDSQSMSKSRSKTHHHKSNHKKHHHHSSTSTTTTTEKPKETTTLTTTEEPVFKEHVYKSPIIKITKDRKHSSFIPIAANAPGPSFSKPIVRPPPHRHEAPTTTTSTQAPTTAKIDEDVKVIYVNSKDKYENVIGSPEFRKALHLDDSTEATEAHLLPTDKDKKKANAHRHADPFNTEYNEDESLEEAEDDPLGELPMSEQEADLYLNDEARIPRVRARSKDLDEYASSSAYYDSTVINSASKLFGAFVLIFISSVFVLFL